MMRSPEFEEKSNAQPEQTKSADQLYAERRFPEAYAARFEEALSELVKEGKIRGFRPTLHNSEDDRNGIDYLIGFAQQEFPFQIQSIYLSGRRRSLRLHRGRSPSSKTKFLAEKGIPRIYLSTRRRGRLKDVPSVKAEVMAKLPPLDAAAH